MNQNKKGSLLDAGKEAQAARLFGQHVSGEKACALLLVTMAVCMLPVAAGLRLWDSIPEIVETGIIRFDGADDSMPRWLVVFGIPGLLGVLNLISHIQLYLNQLRMTMPKLFIRMLGRWGGPVLSTVISNAAVFGAAKQPVPFAYAASCALGLALLLLGSHMLGCPQNALFSLRFSFLINSPRAWGACHRLAGYLWMACGLVFLVLATARWGLPPFALAALPFVLALPPLYGRLLRAPSSQI